MRKFFDNFSNPLFRQQAIARLNVNTLEGVGGERKNEIFSLSSHILGVFREIFQFSPKKLPLLSSYD
jgi:hypothetical protein